MARGFSLAVILGSIILCSLLLPGPGRGERSPFPSLQEYLRCPSLPDTGSACTVSVYVAKALDKPGLVCVRMFNGLSEMISYGLPLGRLQQWEEGTWWRKEKFRDFQDVSTLPDGSRVMVPLVRLFLPAEERRDGNLPYSDLPAPPGRYRVCFDYSVARQGVK